MLGVWCWSSLQLPSSTKIPKNAKMKQEFAPFWPSLSLSLLYYLSMFLLCLSLCLLCLCFLSKCSVLSLCLCLLSPCFFLCHLTSHLCILSLFHFILFVLSMPCRLPLFFFLLILMHRLSMVALTARTPPEILIFKPSNLCSTNVMLLNSLPDYKNSDHPHSFSDFASVFSPFELIFTVPLHCLWFSKKAWFLDQLCMCWTQENPAPKTH